ncbi:MAG: phosphodiester glycosidase family protein [Candidatus Gastranaerophilales bacterium]|nr:phosphodiester glycosidase family protein [Candidatus Gastranaerophilales bacterium]
MDTLVLQRPRIEKNATSAAGIVIAFCLMLSLPANGISVGNYTGISPTLNYIKEEQANRELLFDSNIKTKYAGAKVADVDKGVKHIKMVRYYNGRPVRINVVEICQGVNGNLNIEPQIASNTLASRRKISSIAAKDNAIVAINGGYFKPQSGVPLGTLMINKKVYTGPIYDRVAMGIFDGGYDMARVQLNASIDTNIGGLKIDNINQPRMLSTHTIVYTPEWGTVSPPSPKYGKQIVIADGKFVKASVEANIIPKNGFVVVGSAKNIDTIIKAKKFKLNVKTNPGWEGVNHIISGGPYLIKNNEIYVDMTAQKLASIGGRNPRTAIGYTKENHLVMVTADGREGSSIGLTLFELANLMKEFGCVNAMNLDGGGSTVMYVKGQVVNRPAVQGGIPLSHVLTVTNS